ncbi:hypothetical protein SLEP1_g4707 [Rubroshorea leprosula]|uniref:Uncharacterized protein n=1 Tax=Rubroshorea leprosula TaxID=152421 RepID=A0AAV5HVI5_9ROSI|nr:hypothetical protein SLEP1_g4707 [Rubroshorea leprosula]
MESNRVFARSAAARKDSGFRQRQGFRNRFAGDSSQFSGWATTFFFYNFPEELEAKFLWNSFQMYGKVVDVYIPRKRDKKGKRYGFVRLSGVKNEMQMERRLNEIWIGSYKMRVKIASDKQRKPATTRKVQGAIKGSGSTSSMNRLVQPGHSYVQAVKGRGKEVDKASEQSQEEGTKEISKKEEDKTRVQENKDGDKTRVQVNKEGEKSERTIEYIPTSDELKWLEGGMIAVVRAMVLVSEIQEQLDADGGSILLSPMGGRRAPEEISRMMWVRISGVPLKAWGERCFQMIRESIGEVLLVHEDTKKKAILWDGRVLILCSEASKIAKKVKLKVGEQVFEIEITEEEWRSDPDWWLSENDRKNDMESESDYSISWCQNEDPEMALDVIGDGEDVSYGSEHLMKDTESNSNLKSVTETEGCFQTVQETDLEEDEIAGLSKECGPQRESSVGPVEGSGPNKRMGWGQIKDTDMEDSFLNAQIPVNPKALQKSEISKKESKKQRLLQECYPETKEEIWAKEATWVTPRTKQRQARRAETCKAGDDKVHIVAAESISNECIVNRNRVLRMEMNMLEVRRLMGVGKRLGFIFDKNEEEIQSRLLEAVDRDGAERRDAVERGLGGSVKKKEVRRLVQVEKPDFLFLQETKLENVDVSICRQLWNSDEFDWVAKGSSGASGGLICMWDRRQFVKREVFTGDGYVGCAGEWGANKKQYFLINVYGPTDRQKKAGLWEVLRKMVTDKEGCWVIAGDFNAVRGPEERRGRSGESPDMKDFDEFIVTTDLVDVKLSNRRYTWYKPDGTAKSRLDRFLLSTEMCNGEEEWIQQGLPRSISDHCAIVLKSRTSDWGPRPFRVLDAWQQHPDFKKFVEDKWSEMMVEGFAGYKCQQKLRLLKGFLKGWNKDVFGNMEAQYEQAVEKIEQVDMQNEISDLEVAEIVKRQEGFAEMWDVLRKREIIWKQKSRSKWVHEGDANTRFFHRVAKGRRAQNNIAGLKCDGAWIDDPVLVKNEIVRYFSRLFQGEAWNRPKPGDIKFQQLSEEKKDWLERPFSVEEIEEGLRSCEGSKAPGPDDYNFNFLKFAWHCIKEDFINFFSEFHCNGKLVRGLNSSFLTMIPKKLNAVELKDYRPISLIGCVYKLLVKVLANRLKSVISEIVSETQSAFVRGRQLVDSVLVLNEVVDEIKKKKQPAFVFKADFEKAYDCVDWAFLDWMMESFGFGTKWRGWIKECLSTARISVLVNGSPTKEFEVGKGLRQGDPLSPFLFLMVAEGLQGLVQRAVKEGMLHGIEIGKKGLSVSMLQFADDTVIMGRADAENIRTVKDILKWFELMSGLRINFSKSSIFCYNVSEKWLKGSAGMIHCRVGRAPFLYLGMPVDGKSGNKKYWELVVNKFRTKLAVWKATTLSFGGRLVLLNSVLSALPIFYMSLYLFPNAVIEELIRIQRRFLWGGADLNKKIPWVKWEYVCRAKAKGGLGVTDLQNKNWALLGKWWYRFGDGVESLWKRVVREKYYGGRREVDITTIECLKVSKIWRDIIRIGGRSLKLRNILAVGFKWEVGEGNRVGFWSDKWIGVKSLRDLFPRLFALSVKKDGKVMEMGCWVEGRWWWRMEWRRGTIGREKDEEVRLEKMLEGVKLKEGAGDVWKWIHATDGKYGVNIAYDFLATSEGVLENQMCKLIWCRLVPSKVAFFGWRLCLDRLPTKDNLQKRGIVLQEGLLCDFCKGKTEEVNHLFCLCYNAWLVWTQVLRWWGLESVFRNTVRGMADFFIGSLGRLVGKELGSCIFLVVAWYLWYSRNVLVFRKDEGLLENLMERMQVKTFIWIKAKVNGCGFSFYEWQTYPMECAMAVKNHKRLRKQFFKACVPLR